MQWTLNFNFCLWNRRKTFKLITYLFKKLEVSYLFKELYETRDINKYLISRHLDAFYDLLNHRILLLRLHIHHNRLRPHRPNA